MSPASRGLAAVAGRLSSDRELIAAAVVAGGAALAIAAVLLGGFVPLGGVVTALLYPLALLFPMLGLAVAAGALWALAVGDRESASPLVAGTPPETAVTAAERAVGREAGRTLRAAERGRYRCRPTDAAADVRGALETSAVRVLESRRGLETAAAREAVREGTWTADPVAAAFLAPDRRQPPDERLREAVDPGRAYRDRVDRTIAAIEAVGRDAPASAEVSR